MKRELRRVAAAALIAGGMGALAFSPVAGAHDAPKKPAMAKMAGAGAASGSYVSVMEKSHREMTGMKMTGDADKDFAMMMIKHHGSAVEMAQIELRDGHDPKIRDMAQKIIDSQKKEIADFEAWLAQNGGHKH